MKSPTAATPATFSLPPAITSYTTPDDDNSYGFGATGPGSVFSANSLHTLHLPGSYHFLVDATSGGTVNLNGLTTLDHAGTRSLRISSTGASSVVNLTSLKSFTGDDQLALSENGSANLGAFLDAFALDFDAEFTSSGNNASLDILVDGSPFASIPVHDLNTVDHYSFDIPGSSNAVVTFVDNGTPRILITNFQVTQAVPEPASLCLLGLAGLPMLLRRRRQDNRI